MAELTPNLAKLFGEHFPDEAERNAAVWRHKASGKWLAHHWALMRIARRMGMLLEPPIHVLERAEPDTVVLLQKGAVVYGNAVYKALAYGVATPENNRNGHHYPMAKKRGEDQVIVDLLEQCYDMALRKDLYGEDESDAFGKEEPAPVERAKTARVRETEQIAADLNQEVAGLMNRMEQPGPLDEWRARILDCKTQAALADLYNDEYTPNIGRFSKKENKELSDMFALHGKSLQ